METNKEDGKKQCSNGHWYDAGKYTECPHCAAGMAPIRQGVFTVEGERRHQGESAMEKLSEDKEIGHKKGKDRKAERKRAGKKGFFGKKDGQSGKGREENGSGGREDKGHSGTAVAKGETQLLESNNTEDRGTITQGFQEKNPRTGGSTSDTRILEGMGAGCNVREEHISAVSENGYQDMENGAEDLDKVPKKDSMPREPGEAPSQEEAWIENKYNRPGDGESHETGRNQGNTPGGAVDEDVADNIGKDSKENMGRGVAGDSRNITDRKDGRTIGYFSTSGGTDPPVGYLICVEGDDYGIGFPLKSGNNSLGRASSMDVVIMDAQVSREKQTFVMYEPHRREFFVRPGDGSGLCYLNDELVMGPKKMEAYDRLQLGNTKLMLIPVCGEKFSW